MRVIFTATFVGMQVLKPIAIPLTLMPYVPVSILTGTLMPDKPLIIARPQMDMAQGQLLLEIILYIFALILVESLLKPVRITTVYLKLLMLFPHGSPGYRWKEICIPIPGLIYQEDLRN